MARGRLAGLAAARDLGLRAPDEPATRAALARALAFQDALWRLFPPTRLLPGTLTDETIVCRCEEVTAGRLRRELAAGLTSLAALKKATRAGMGRCQGRFCSATIARLCPDAPDDFAFAAPRAPLRPVPAAPLMFEAPEFEAPLLEAPNPPARLHPVPDLPAETRHADVLVIGGGLAGMCTAYFLAKDGADVLLAERDEAGMAASTANAGSLHVQLLSYDFDDDTPEDGGPAAHALPLAPRSIALWKQIADEAGESLGIRTEGGLMLADSAAGMDWLRRKSAMERRWGIESHVLGANELRDLAPALDGTMVGCRFRAGRGLRRSAARHDGGAEARATPRRPPAARRGGPGDLARRRRVAGDDEQGRDHGRAGGERHRPVGGAHRPDGGARSAGDRHGAAGDRHRTGAASDAAPDRAGHRHLSLKQQASGGFLVGGGWFGGFDPASGRTHNLRRKHRGQSMGLRARAAGVAEPQHHPLVDRDQPGDRPRTDTRRGTRVAGVLQCCHCKRLYARADRREDHRRCGAGGEHVNPHYRLERFG